MDPSNSDSTADRELSDEERIDRLEAAARDRWAEHWTIEVLRFATGDRSAHAFRSLGLDDDGRLVRDRLFISPDGTDSYVMREHIDRSVEDIEVIDPPSDPAVARRLRDEQEAGPSTDE